MFCLKNILTKNLCNSSCLHMWLVSKAKINKNASPLRNRCRKQTWKFAFIFIFKSVRKIVKSGQVSNSCSSVYISDIYEFSPGVLFLQTLSEKEIREALIWKLLFHIISINLTIDREILHVLKNNHLLHWPEQAPFFRL